MGAFGCMASALVWETSQPEDFADKRGRYLTSSSPALVGLAHTPAQNAVESLSEYDPRERRRSARSQVFMRVNHLNPKQESFLLGHWIGRDALSHRSSHLAGDVRGICRSNCRVPKARCKLVRKCLRSKRDIKPVLRWGLRFCLLPDHSKVLIYRFMDTRRKLWAQLQKKKPLTFASSPSSQTLSDSSPRGHSRRRSSLR